MVLVQICGQRLCFSEKVDLPCVRHVKHLLDETAVDSLKLEVPLYRYSKANPDDAEAIFSAQGVGGISEGGEQCYQASAELGTECWVVFPVGKAVDREILLQQLVRGIREGVKDIFRRHALPTGELVVGKIDVLEDIIKDVKGRGKITGCVRACEDVVRPVLDHDMLRGAQYPDAGAAAVATYVYAQTAVGQLYVSNGVRFSGWETDESQSAQVALALPRDDGLTPVIPRQLGGPDQTAPWPSTSAHVSFAGPVDLDTFHIKQGVWLKAAGQDFGVRQTRVLLQSENDRPPREGIHICHVLVLFFVDQQPWKSLGRVDANRRECLSQGIVDRVTVVRLLGVLNRDLIQGPRKVDPTIRILVILADNWELIRQNPPSTNNTPTPKSSDPVGNLPTTPRSAGPGALTSRNPFSSLGRAQNPTSSPQNPSSAPVAPETAKREATEPPSSPGARLDSITADPDQMPTGPSSDGDDSNDGSDTEELLNAQLVSGSSTPTKKRKEPSSPEPARSKRSTAGRKKARLYD
ncbi:hypothetical protein CHGG_05412 [Chaetomium globosum CBS 148.51]|uniref:Uncharacterized protein n=1 Tax=Chaetomium globosum (strain ATCC 6205 / CBS 148.51 / DSM 1962 / NBRC 6347 / NRRL 1970) TaxID=306901 RepID=Q2H7F3_CHAGB|nr:uncharacterized protein CHGG_05412 [Chaetomium globosum CBS 148.51]EAQ88793.1 hypothetical protein CHGG_05412 [Chaetomium globosum CBS 148.51]